MMSIETKTSDDFSELTLPREYSRANERRDVDFDNLSLNVESTNKWRVYKRLGQGKYSEVFEGKNTETNEIACVKILKPVIPKLFKLEVYVLQELSKGPNIVQLYYTLKDDRTDLWCLVFELLKCKELKEITKVINDNEMRYYLYEILKGLDYSHSQGIMHRDIKPANVLIDEMERRMRIETKYISKEEKTKIKKIKNNNTGKTEYPKRMKAHTRICAKLADFGLAKTDTTSITSRVGTQNYMAPEMKNRNRDRRLGYSTDIHSYGLVICETLLGIMDKQITNEKRNLQEVILCHLKHLVKNDEINKYYGYYKWTHVKNLVAIGLSFIETQDRSDLSLILNDTYAKCVIQLNSANGGMYENAETMLTQSVNQWRKQDPAFYDDFYNLRKNEGSEFDARKTRTNLFKRWLGEVNKAANC